MTPLAPPPVLCEYVLQNLATGIQFYTIKATPYEITRANVNLARNHCESRYLPAEDTQEALSAPRI
jgi:hypothetical protein